MDSSETKKECENSGKDNDSAPRIITKTDYKGTAIVVLEDVYEPAEDSFLLADCAVLEISKNLFDSENRNENRIENQNENKDENQNENKDENQNENKNKIRNEKLTVFEVGCGSGFISSFIQNNFSNISVSAVDINPNAVLCAQKNGVCAVLSDMFESLQNGDLFDVIVFNPPYLPTADDEKVDGYLNYAFDGGVSGRDSIDLFLKDAGFYLKENGFFLLLISSLTGLDEVIFEMNQNGFEAKIVGTEKCSFEELIVLKGKRF